MSNYLRKLGVYHTPPPLSVPRDATLTGYVINTNGLMPVTLHGDDAFDKGRLCNKMSILRDTVMELNIDVLHISETHDSKETLTTPTDTWSCHSSVKGIKTQGAATFSRLEVTEATSDTNVSQVQILWEKEKVWLITAYFPNKLPGTIATTRAVDAILRQKHGARVILAGDFNSTETLASSSTGGLLDASDYRAKRAACIQQLLDKWRLKDGWMQPQNPFRNRERDDLTHLTHWNQERTRGVRIDRIYLNFDIVGATLEVSTLHHPGSDHKGILYKIKGSPGPEKVDSPKALPHRAFDLPEVIGFASVRLAEFNASPVSGIECFGAWDVLKSKVKNFAQHTWETHVKTQGADLRKIKNARSRAEENLNKTSLDNPNRGVALKVFRSHNLALEIALARDLEERAEAANASWICSSGKPHKDFLRKPRGRNAKIRNMTIDNVKNMPDLPRTDEVGTIMDNFVTYYGELYCDKPVNTPTLDRMIDSLTLKLDEADAAGLGAPISVNEVREVLGKVPRAKTPGPDALPYEIYRALPGPAALAMTKIANLVTDLESQPDSWLDINVAVLPKEEDSYSTHKFRPISLLNNDYKIVMRVWANRMGPILAKRIGHHQRGFIPTRDGRENIINVQLLIDLINAKNEEGAVIFLDQEKAFDMVSFTAINRIFEKLEWPSRFQSLMHTVYRRDQIKAKIRVNGVLSDKACHINSGTRQGCPLSPLIFAVVADLFNMSIISNPDFIGHCTDENTSSKISAFADDTAVHLGSLGDIAIYRKTLMDYSAATGGITNLAKSEAVLLGNWRQLKPDVGVRTVKASKYLGVITGDDKSLSAKAITERIAKVHSQIDMWDSRLSSSPVDRAMVAKTMCLSTIWYHAGLMPGWEKTLDELDKKVTSFIWKGTMSKVARATLLLPKEKGGLGLWSLRAKNNAFRSSWILKLALGKLNPYLESTLRMAAVFYARAANTEVPLWESRVDHSSTIRRVTGSELLAELQAGWANIIRRRPSFAKGDLVAYSDEEEPGRLRRDTLYGGKGVVIEDSTSDDREVKTQWYTAEEDGSYSLSPQIWNLPVKKCYLLDGSDIQGEMVLAPSKADSLYITTDIDPETERDKVIWLKDLDIKIEDKDSEEQLSQFRKLNENSELYKAQLKISAITNIKLNAWERDYGTDHLKLRSLARKSWAHSRIRGFNWLLASHALPVANRMRGKDSCSTCKCCGKADETIRHMTYGCKWAKDVRNIVFTEWWGRTGDPTQVILPSFRRSVLCTVTTRESSMDSMRRTLNHITSYFIWRMRCSIVYNDEVAAPPVITANGVWKEFETTIKARLKQVRTKDNWWADKVRLGDTSQSHADEAMTKMRAEAAEAKVVLTDWNTPESICPDTKETIRKWCFETSGNDADIAAIPRPSKFPRWNFKWKLSTYPASGGDGSSEPDGGPVAPPIRQSLPEEGVA